MRTGPQNCFVYGTRPEAVKLYPVIRHTRDKVVICTGQHDELLDGELVEPDMNLGLMAPGQSLSTLTARINERLDTVFDELAPRRVIVQGDTATAFCAALVAFHKGIEIAHVEAGLRTHNRQQPFPEEVYRTTISHMADIHFAPTEHAALHLREEQGKVYVTGNPVIDAVRHFAPAPTIEKKIIVTLHRRESAVDGYILVLKTLVAAHPDYDFRIYAHPNGIGQELRRHFDCAEPLGYRDFLAELASCYLVMTDSGGIQEEAPALDKPVVILRDTTERPEGLGTCSAIPIDVVRYVAELIENPDEYRRMASAACPYGDGNAGEKIAAILNGEECR